MERVSIVKCKTYDYTEIREAVEQTFENLGGLQRFIKPGMKVLLKPNLVMRKKPECAATTHPVFVEAVAGLVKEAGAAVTIADSPGGLYTANFLKSVYSVCGMENAARNSGVVLNFDTSVADIENPRGKLLKRVTAIKPVIEHDLVINLPKLKTHGMMAYTGAVKNFFGIIPGELKAELHFRMSNHYEFADMLVDIHLSVKNSITLMDAVIGMDGHGPTSGNPFPIGLVLGGADAFAVDLAALGVIQVNAMDIPVIKNAHDRNLCGSSCKDIEIYGEEIEKVKVVGFEMPALHTLKTIRFLDNRLFDAIVSYLKPKPMFIHELCTGCSECERNCPPKIIKMNNKRPSADISQCIRCFCCQELCPAKAINIKESFVTRLFMSKYRRCFYG